MRRSPISFGLVVVAAIISGTAALTILGTQGMTGGERPSRLLLTYSTGWFLLFGIAPALLMLFSATGRRSVLAAFIAFGLGGGVSGGLIAMLLVTHRLGGSLPSLMIDFTIPFTLPWIVGAVLLKCVKAKSALYN
jgi:hypothetical protein